VSVKSAAERLVTCRLFCPDGDGQQYLARLDFEGGDGLSSACAMTTGGRRRVRAQKEEQFDSSWLSGDTFVPLDATKSG